MSKYRFDQIAINSKAKKKPTEEDKYHYIGLEHIDSQNLTISRWGSEVAPKGEKLLMKKGDVLFGKRRAYQKKVAIAPFDGIFSAHGMVLRPNEEVIDKNFFPMFISSDYFLDAAIAISVGSLSPTINWKDLARLEFDLPPIEEQRKLAEVLWSINDTLQAYQKLLTETDALMQAQFVEMFGDPITNDKGWEMTALGNVADIRIGPFGSLLHKGDYIEGGHALVNPSHIVDGKIIPDEKLTISDEKYEELSAYKLKKGDLVLGRRGEMGRCAVVNCEGLLCGTGSLIIRPTGKIRPFFLQKILSSPSYRTVIEGKAVGITMKNLNVPIVSSLSLPLLPVSLQNKYIDFVQQSNKSQSALQNTITSLQNTKRCILKNTLRTERKE